MRTLKKVLALTMVIAMSLSFMANAAFKDESSMNADLVDDVNLVAALGIMKGDGDAEGNATNNFSPTRVLKRGEAAKILYVLLTGSDAIDNASWTSLANRTFTDTVGHWSDAYVNFVAKENGIIQGTSATTFEPEATLTGTQFAKMLLCLIGYNSDKEGYTGADWAANVLRDGQKAGLFVDYLPSVSAPVTREWAAKMIVNAIIDTDMVGYYGHYNGTTYEIQRITEDFTYGEKVLKLHISYAFAIGNNNIQIAETQSEVFVNEDGKHNTSKFALDFAGFAIGTDTDELNYEPANLSDLNKAKINIDASLLGRLVKVISKTSGTNNYSMVYGVYAVDKAQTTTINAASLSKYTDDKFYWTVNGTKTSYKAAAKINVFADFVGMGSSKIASAVTASSVTAGKILPVGLTHASKMDGTTEIGFTGFGSNDSRALILVDYNDDGLFDAAFVNTASYAVVSSYNSAKNTFKVNSDSVSSPVNLATTLAYGVTKAADFERYTFGGDLEEDDVVRVTFDFTTGKEAYEVTELEPVIGTFKEFTRGGNAINKVSIDGTFYSQGVKGNIVDLANFPLAKDDEDLYVSYLREQYELYTDGIFYVYGRTYDDSLTALTANVCMVIQFADIADGNNIRGYSWAVKVLMADGTVEVLTYKPTDKQVENGTAISGHALSELVNDEGMHPVFEYVRSGDNIYFKNKFETDKSENYKISAPKAYTQYINGGMILEDPKDVEDSYFDDFDTAAYIDYAKDAKVIALGSATNKVRIANDSIIFIYSDPKNYTVVKGSEMGTALTNLELGSYIYRESNGLQTLVMAAVQVDDYKASVSSSNYGIVIADAITGYDGDDDVITIKVMNLNGTAETLKVKTADLEGELSSISAAHSIRNLLIAYDVLSNGYSEIELVTQEDTGSYDHCGSFPAASKFSNMDAKLWYAGAVVGRDDTTALVEAYAYDGLWNYVASDYLEYASNMKVWTVDVNESKVTLDYDEANDWNDIVKADEVTAGGLHFVNALFRVNSDGKITHIIVDVNFNKNILGSTFDPKNVNKTPAFGYINTIAPLWEAVAGTNSHIYTKNGVTTTEYLGKTSTVVVAAGVYYRNTANTTLYDVSGATLVTYTETATSAIYKNTTTNALFTRAGNDLTAMTQLGTTGYYYDTTYALYKADGNDADVTANVYTVGADSYIQFGTGFVKVVATVAGTDDTAITAGATHKSVATPVAYYKYDAGTTAWVVVTP